MYRVLVILLISLGLFCSNSLAADFENANFRTQLFLQGSPVWPLSVEYSTKDSTNTVRNRSVETNVYPIGAGFQINPLITPFFKADLPLDFWIGIELTQFFKTQLLNESSTIESAELLHAQPGVFGGLSFNLFGPVDLELLGGAGLSINKAYYYVDLDRSSVQSEFMQYFGQATLEVLLYEGRKGPGIKLGAYARKDFQDGEQIRFLKSDQYKVTDATSIPYAFPNLTVEKAQYSNVKFGIEFSLDFGRESNVDRKIRYQLYNRDEELRRHNKDLKPMDDWDCLAIERDYRFYLDHTNKMPDVRADFNRTEFLDIMENYLVFCKPENLDTKKALYRSLDSNKIVLKRYQESQEDKRYRQVINSNDVAMLEMYLRYYPESPKKAEIEEKIIVLKEFQDWNKAKKANSFQSYIWYLQEHPQGKFAQDAETSIFNLVKQRHRLTDYEIYLKKFPNGKYVNDAKRAIHEIKTR